MKAKQLEENRVAVQVESGATLEIKEEPHLGKIVFVYDTGKGPKKYFEFNYEEMKLSELKTFG